MLPWPPSWSVRGGRLGVALVALLVVAAGCLSGLPGFDESGTPGLRIHEAHNETIPGQGGTAIATTVFKPAGASAEAPVPMVLHSHGWAGNRTWAPTGVIGDLLDGGYGVVSIDMRGHGGSAGQARVHSMDHEIVDVQRVIDHVSTLAWVQLEAPGDPVLGAMGGSYGGAYQLLTAAVDERLDALAPEITWNDLPQALVPNGAVKSGWIHALYAAGTAQARLHEDIAEAWNQALATNTVPEDIMEGFTRSSPASYPEAIDVPTLLIQGVPDTLFNLNQAVANLEQIRATGTDARLVTHLSGHLLNLGTLAEDEDLQQVTFPQPGDRGSPCGDIDELRLAWFDEHLKGKAEAAEAISNVSMAMEDGETCLGFDAWPPVATPTSLSLPGPVVLAQGPAGGPVDLALSEDHADALALAGIPQVNLTVTAGVANTIYLSLVRAAPSSAGAVDQRVVIDSQVIPIRFEGPTDGEELSMELGGVAAEVGPGQGLYLRLSNWNEQYATNAERVPGAVTITDIEVQLPILDDRGT